MYTQVAGGAGHQERPRYDTGGRHTLRAPVRLPRDAAPVHNPQGRPSYLRVQVSKEGRKKKGGGKGGIGVRESKRERDDYRGEIDA